MRVRGKRCGPQKQNQGGTEDGFCPVHSGLLGAPSLPADWAASILGNARLYRNSGRSEGRSLPGPASGIGGLCETAQRGKNLMV